MYKNTYLITCTGQTIFLWGNNMNIKTRTMINIDKYDKYESTATNVTDL